MKKQGVFCLAGYMYGLNVCCDEAKRVLSHGVYAGIEWAL